MATRAEKLRMTEFTANKLEESRLYDILEKDYKSILLQEKTGISDKNDKIRIMLHNKKTPINEFWNSHSQDKKQNIYTAHLFYKDGKNFFVRLVDRESWRTDKSLKKYTGQQINQMLSLRALEKKVLDLFPQSRLLAYYQPETELLPEGVRLFKMDDVELDYSHLTPNDRGYDFAENRTSIDYKLPREQQPEPQALLVATKSKNNNKAKLEYQLKL